MRIIIKSKYRKNYKQTEVPCRNCETNPVTKNARLVTNFLTKYQRILKSEFDRETAENLCDKCLQFNLNQLKFQEKHDIDRDFDTGASVTGIQKGNCIFTEIPSDSQTFQEIVKRVHQSSQVNVIRIEKSINKLLLDGYRRRKMELFNDDTLHALSFDFRIDNTYCENYLFHGSSNQAYDNILDKGFDISYSKSTGILGQGIYFAADASYSMSGYACNLGTDIGRVGILLLCRVLIGKTTKGSSGIRDTPKGYHSVCSDTLNAEHQNYVVFNNCQAYPEYIIYYKNQK